MDGIFQEYENENALRTYPFAAGCLPPSDADAVIPAGVFVDAALYPVNPSGTLYLSSVSETSVFSISDDTGVVMTGVAKDGLVEFYDTTGLSRHVGTMVASSADALSEFAGRGILREYSVSQTAFASSCVFPVVIDGVTSMTVGDAGQIPGTLKIANGADGAIRASSGTLADGRKTLRFDVLPRPEVTDDFSIRRIICVVDGQTPFRIKKLYEGGNTIELLMPDIDKDAVCAAAHRESQFEMADTCGCGSGGDEKCSKATTDAADLPQTYQLEEVFIPPDADGSEGGLKDGNDNAFYLVVPNELGYANPLSLTLEEGVVAPKISEPEVVVDGLSVELAAEEMLDKITSNGVVLQVPGLSGGMI